MWHWPLLAFVRIAQGDTPTPTVRLGVIVASIALAWLTYRLVEKPIRFAGYGKRKTVALVLLMAAVGGAGYATYSHKAFSFRFPPIIQELTTSKYDYMLGYQLGTCFLNPDQGFTALNNAKHL